MMSRAATHFLAVPLDDASAPQLKVSYHQLKTIVRSHYEEGSYRRLHVYLSPLICKDDETFHLAVELLPKAVAAARSVLDKKQGSAGLHLDGFEQPRPTDNGKSADVLYARLVGDGLGGWQRALAAAVDRFVEHGLAPSRVGRHVQMRAVIANSIFRLQANSLQPSAGPAGDALEDDLAPEQPRAPFPIDNLLTYVEGFRLGDVQPSQINICERFRTGKTYRVVGSEMI